MQFYNSMYNHHTLHVTEGVQSTVLLYVYIKVHLGIIHIIQDTQTTQHQPSPSHFGALPLRLPRLGRLLYDDKFTFSDSFHTSQIDLKLNSSGVPNPPSLFITVDKEKYEEKDQRVTREGPNESQVHKSVLIHEI